MKKIRSVFMKRKKRKILLKKSDLFLCKVKKSDLIKKIRSIFYKILKRIRYVLCKVKKKKKKDFWFKKN